MHEIKNPLETLGNLTYLASQEADSPDQVRQYMHLAEEQVATLNRIASRVLGFARSSYDPQLTDVVDLVEAAIRIHQRTIQAKRIRLVKELPRDLKAKLHGDQILQVVSNLMANALDALPDGGTLALRLSRHAAAFRLTVADNGHGIKSEDLRRVCEPFFTTKGNRGNGLGLSLSTRIIEEHGGSLKVKSSVHPRWHGTAFKVLLPA